MTSFYQHLREHKSKDEALFLAKKEMIAANGKPYAWAGVIPIGNMEPIDIKRPVPWVLIISSLLVLAALLFVFFMKKKTRRGEKIG